MVVVFFHGQRFSKRKMEILPNFTTNSNQISIKLEPEIVLLQSESESEDDNFAPEQIEVVPELVLQDDDDNNDDHDDDDDNTYNNFDGSNVDYGKYK